MIDQLKQDVEALVASGGRMPGSPGHDAARRHLISRLEALNLPGLANGAYELPYHAGAETFVNVMARVPGADPEQAPVLIAAHYDTFGPYPGADDNAAAVSIALAAGERLKERNLKRDAILAFFDAEEPPHYLSESMGSVYWYQRQRTAPVHCALVMDLVGHDVPVPGLEDLVFLTGMESDPGLAPILRTCEPGEGIRTIATLNRYIGDLSDYYVFRVNRRPYLFLSCGHWAHYHQPTDTPEKLNYEKMAAIAGYLIETATAVAAAELRGPFEGYDTTNTELDFLRRAIGPMVEAFGLKLESRADIDRLVQTMVMQFGL